MSTLLTLQNLRKSMGGRLLLDVGRFEIEEGACLVLSGRNGAGKSTLLKIIAGLEPPDQLDVTYGGQTQPWRQVRRRLQQEVVYLHQQPYMFDRSVEENIAYGLRLAGVSKPDIPHKVSRALEWAGLKHLAGKNARRLSGGEKQRVALTRARVLSPRLLLLDEPFASMDLDSREQSLFFIHRLREEGIGTIITTHEPSVARVLDGRHLHLCKTGPCRYTMVRPFLYDREHKQTRLSARGDIPSMSPPSDVIAGPATDTTGNSGDDRPHSPLQDVTGVILSGGMGRRMGGQDKGLLPIDGNVLVSHIINTISPQVSSLLINANRNLDNYRGFGHPVVQDMLGEYFGPLVGIASAMQVSETPYLLSVPCDSPLLPADLASRLYQALKKTDADISVAHDGTRLQPVFAMLKRALLPDLLDYLENGGRKIDTWYGEHSLVLVDFSDRPEAFLNINTPEELSQLEAVKRQS